MITRSDNKCAKCGEYLYFLEKCTPGSGEWTIEKEFCKNCEEEAQ